MDGAWRAPDGFSKSLRPPLRVLIACHERVEVFDDPLAARWVAAFDDGAAGGWVYKPCGELALGGEENAVATFLDGEAKGVVGVEFFFLVAFFAWAFCGTGGFRVVGV